MRSKNFKRGMALTIALLLVAGVPATAPFAFNTDFDLSALFSRLWSPPTPRLPVVDREALNRWAEEIVAGRAFAPEASTLLASDDLITFTPTDHTVPPGYVTAPVFGHAIAMLEAERFHDFPQPPARLRPMALPALARVSASGGIGVSAGGGTQSADAGGPPSISAAAETPTADISTDAVAQVDVADATAIPRHLPAPGALPLVGFGLIGLLGVRRRRR